MVARFAEYLALERRSSPHTVAAYRRDLTSLVDFLRERLEREPRLSDVSRMTLRSWLGSIGAGLAPTSIARKLSSVRAFYVFLGRTGEVRENPAALLQSPKLSRGLPLVLRAETAAEVVEAPDEGPIGSEIERLRDRVLLELLYGSGLRVSELFGLDLDAVDVRAAELRVVGKGRKERIVPMSGKALEALAAYLPRRSELAHPRTRKHDERALLLSVRGRRLGVRAIQKLGRSIDTMRNTLDALLDLHQLESGVIRPSLGELSLWTTAAALLAVRRPSPSAAVARPVHELGVRRRRRTRRRHRPG